MTPRDEAFAKRQQFLQALTVLINYAGRRISDNGEFEILAISVLEAADINRHELELATSSLEAQSLSSGGKH